MNDLIYIKDNYNVVSATFVKNGKIISQVYNWYYEDYYKGKIFLDEELRVSIDNKMRKIKVVYLSYHPRAKELYKKIELSPKIKSWQIRYICKYLEEKGFVVYKERIFKGLSNERGKNLHVDVSFVKNGKWYFVEYHGVHHYFKMSATLQSFKNMRKNMEIRRLWCKENQVPYLEIPFFYQNDIEQLLNKFLKRDEP